MKKNKKKDKHQKSKKKKWYQNVVIPEIKNTREDKAARTKGIPMTGKITLSQYELLVKEGYDGEVVMKWTKYRAQLEISKICGTKPIKWQK